MKRAHFPSAYLYMLTIGSFLFLVCGLGGCVWWACLEDRNET